MNIWFLYWTLIVTVPGEDVQLSTYQKAFSTYEACISELATTDAYLMDIEFEDKTISHDIFCVEKINYTNE